MIKEVTMYTVICDNCGYAANKDEEMVAWSDELSAKEVAMEGGFLFHEGNHYCPECWRYDDNDNVEINLSRASLKTN